jgi:hypothetical protein
MIRTDLTYEQALALPDPKQISLSGSQVIVDTDPPKNVPHEVEAYQARLALKDSGLLASVEAFITQQNGDLAIRWEFSGKIHRNSPDVLAVATALNLSSEDLDNLFIAASAKL